MKRRHWQNGTGDLLHDLLPHPRHGVSIKSELNTTHYYPMKWDEFFQAKFPDFL